MYEILSLIVFCVNLYSFQKTFMKYFAIIFVVTFLMLYDIYIFFILFDICHLRGVYLCHVLNLNSIFTIYLEKNKNKKVSRHEFIKLVKGSNIYFFCLYIVWG